MTIPTREDTFMSFHFWLNDTEVEQLTLLSKQYEMQTATLVQRIVKHALKQLGADTKR